MGRKFDHSLILPSYAEEILKVCIQSSRDSDFIAWHYEKNDLFSIKNAYNLVLKLMERKEDRGQSSGGVNGDRRLWNVIWKANVP